MHEIRMGQIIDYLWKWLSTNRNRSAVKDTTKVKSIKFDCYLESTISDPLSASIFELSDKGELVVDDMAKLIESKAAYFMFVNPPNNFIVLVQNTLENCTKLGKGERLDNLKVKIIN